MSDNTSTFSLETDGDLLKVTYGTGESYIARFGGAPAQVVGAPSGATVSVRRLSDKAFQEIEMSDGEVISTVTSTLLDNSTLEIVSRKEGSGRETRRRAHRR